MIFKISTRQWVFKKLKAQSVRSDRRLRRLAVRRTAQLRAKSYEQITFWLHTSNQQRHKLIAAGFNAPVHLGLLLTVATDLELIDIHHP